MEEQEYYDDDNAPYEDSINRVKLRKREELSIVRKQGRDNAYRQRRVHLSEAQALVTNIPLSQFKELVFKVSKSKPSLEDLKTIKNNCCSLPYIESFFRTFGAFESLSRVLISQKGLLQLESAACLTNLACGSHKASRRIAKGAGVYLVSFMTGRSPYLQSQCTWAVGNIAHDCLECLSIMKPHGILSALLVVLQSPSPEVVQSAVFALHACTKYEDDHFKDLASPNIRQFLLDLLKQENSSSKSDAAFSLANIYCLCVKNNIEVYFGEVVQILGLLYEITREERNVNTSVALPLMRCLGFLSSSDALCEQLYKQKNFHDLIIKALGNKVLRKEVLWVLTNISTINHEDRFESNIVHKTIEQLQSPAETLTNQDLYFLCVLVTQCESMKLELLRTEIVPKVNFLVHHGHQSVKQACECFLNLMNVKL